jgi:peptidoglycan LD-endopeptidase LytH
VNANKVVAVVAGAGALLLLRAFDLRCGLTARALVEFWQPPAGYLVPVEGVAPRSLSGSFGAPRSERRTHEGIDIFAPRGTPVVAAAAGRVIRVGTNRLGGNVVWVAGAGAQLYYYAHLDSYRDGITVGEPVVPGSVLGYVGTTGNAVHTPPHLHFGVYPFMTRFRAIDPYPMLRHARYRVTRRRA